MATYDIDSLPSKLKTGDIVNCPYKGSVRSITLPKGQYKLECWGGRGFYYSVYGGNGGYAVGTLNLITPTLLYCYAGAGATDATQTNSAQFNGGGATNSYGGSGAGGSDVRIAQDSLYARVIVAGGGGGAGYSSTTGGYGGGLNGGQGGNGSATGGYGGSQTSGGSYYTAGSFGQANSNTSNGGGGGGGWYGGGSGVGSGTDTGGGGGSGYVYTSSTASNYPSGCLLNSSYYLTDAQTIGGDTSFPSTAGGTETGHAGSGYVRITVIKVQSFEIPVKVGNSWKTGDAGWVKINGVWKEIEAISPKISGAWKGQ